MSKLSAFSANVPIIDTNTGKLTREGVRLFQDLFERVGGFVAPTNTENSTAAQAAQTAANAAQTAADGAQTAATAAQNDVNALKAPAYVTLSASTALSSERVLTQGVNIVITDGGAGSPVTVDLAANITGSSKDMTIQPLAPSALINGGTMALKGQNATGTNKNGGQVVCQAGDGTGTGVGGQCSFYSGGGRAGGAINFIGGAGTVTGGAVNLAAGDGATTGGSVNIAPGLGGTTPGSIYLNSSGGTTSGVQVTDDNAGNTLVSLFGAAPVAQPTTAIASAAFVANAGTAMNSASTAGGYTFGQVVQALKDTGVLA